MEKAYGVGAKLIFKQLDSEQLQQLEKKKEKLSKILRNGWNVDPRGKWGPRKAHDKQGIGYQKPRCPSNLITPPAPLTEPERNVCDKMKSVIDKKLTEGGCARDWFQKELKKQNHLPNTCTPELRAKMWRYLRDRREEEILASELMANVVTPHLPIALSCDCRDRINFDRIPDWKAVLQERVYRGLSVFVGDSTWGYAIEGRRSGSEEGVFLALQAAAGVLAALPEGEVPAEGHL